jgi:ribose transport system permease protein
MGLSNQYLLVGVILLVGAFFSVNTITEYQPENEASAEELVERVIRETPADASIFIALPAREDAFADAVERRLHGHARTFVRASAYDGPAELKERFDKVQPAPTVVIGNRITAIYEFLKAPGLSFYQAPFVHGSSFLTVKNFLEILDTMSVIAVMAIGMTLVIVAGGIDLSVGRMAAFATVLATWLIREFAGGRLADALSQIGCVLTALAACAALGWMIGCCITFFQIPSFIVTLAFMLVLDGAAEKLSQGQTITGMPESFGWLGRNQHALLMMFLLYGAAYVFMSRTVLGRYIYAVGGSAEAARLSGVPVRRVTIFVYVVSAMLAGLAGIFLASLHRVGDYKFATNYELYAIAAVVIGGTSLRGGEGTITGTFLGALLITVVDKGMSMMGLSSDSQRINKGVILLLAAFIDQLKHWRLRRSRV